MRVLILFLLFLFVSFVQAESDPVLTKVEAVESSVSKRSAVVEIATSRDLKNDQEETVLPIVTKYKKESDTKAIFLHENTLVFPYASARNALFMYYKSRFFSRDSVENLTILGGTTLGTALIVAPTDTSFSMLMGGAFLIFGMSGSLLSDVHYFQIFGSEAMKSDYLKSIHIKSHEGQSLIVFPTEEASVKILTTLAEKTNKAQGLFSFVTAPEEAAFEKYILRNATADVTMYQGNVVYREQLLKATNKFRSELGFSLMLATAPLLLDKKAAGYAIPYFGMGSAMAAFDMKQYDESVFFHTNYENEDYFKEIQFRQKSHSVPWFWMHFLEMAIGGTYYAMTGNAVALGIGLFGGYQLMHEPYGMALKGEL